MISQHFETMQGNRELEVSSSNSAAGQTSLIDVYIKAQYEIPFRSRVLCRCDVGRNMKLQPVEFRNSISY